MLSGVGFGNRVATSEFRHKVDKFNFQLLGAFLRGGWVMVSVGLILAKKVGLYAAWLLLWLVWIVFVISREWLLP